MGEVYFYHVTQKPLVSTLYTLLEKSLQAGWRVAVRGQDPQYLSHLDTALWSERNDGFLPHGVVGGDHDADQPILLTFKAESENGATSVIAVDGAEVTKQDAEAMQRVSILFDGNKPEDVDRARAQWKSLTGEGVKAVYWSEETGSWAKKAESK
ncbi:MULTISPECIES: DNA polymerase III subunit chi [Halocynthiibacter]|uniref:DNA polymerase III subunit chi n=1 Tax=Halocynthiibacter halioticoli TaxID=2986804 RepID=A0AAE3LRI1_9RHOB|nr:MULTISPECIES: DNA polymerase III subunit chi [Halocynthiibacter]MCV6824608.1 DNA polymerase III subunit chi [Halocynthiibacter halioticoli]MCW4057609.1 DNA polymerase III subunit chi [Halocynthiibacter sp. SDUM655004]MDE0589358.1 DNA polymerase III subunit chi [Halocynthiibacter sp. C4]